jgi:hypothetical protein
MKRLGLVYFIGIAAALIFKPKFKPPRKDE